MCYAHEVCSLSESGFANGRSETSPDSEEIERNARMCKERNFPSVENKRAKSKSGSVLVYCERSDKQIQDRVRGQFRINIFLQKT